MKLSKLCGCGRIVIGDCEACRTQRNASAEDYRATSGQRYGSAWEGLSKRYRAKNPLCENCLKHGITTQAIEVHHKEKARDRPDLIYQWDNLMSVCRACHVKLDAAK
jgi:5-methylcytosine-specific restriction protein A